MGALTLTCLTMLVAELPQDVWPVNRREFSIPIDIDKSRQKEISRLILFVSTDRGKSWQQESTVTPDKKGFFFTTAKDGEYWFKAAAVNRFGKQQPDNIYKGRVDQKVMIDTVKPVITIQNAERRGEDVVVRWLIQESLPDARTVVLKYRTASSSSLIWSEAKIVPKLRGEAKIQIKDPGPVAIRIEVRDLAGNHSHVQANVAGALTTVSYKKDPTEVPMIPGKPDGGLPVLPLDTKIPDMPKLPKIDKTPDLAAKRIPAPDVIAQNKSLTSWDSAGAKAPVFPKVEKKRNPPIAGTSAAPGFPPRPKVSTRPPLPKPQVPVKFVNKPEVTIAYELANVQPGRVGSIELWLTRDNGRKWEKWMEDPAAKPYMKKGPHTRTLNLPGDGQYGLTLVVRNRAGRGKEPKPGDAPEMRIQVDMAPPVAVLYAPEQDKKVKEALVISWEARDTNLTNQPIALEYSEQHNGPWQSIATNLPNTGHYSWRLPPNLPVYVFLRVRVRDKAGNEAVAVSTEPQLVDLSEPQGRLIGIVSGGGDH